MTALPIQSYFLDPDIAESTIAAEPEPEYPYGDNKDTRL